MWKLVWREIRRPGSRFGAAVGAVFLGVSLLTIPLALASLVFGALIAAQTSILPGDLYVVGKNTTSATATNAAERTLVDAKLVNAIERVDGVSHAVADVQGEVVLLKRDGKPAAVGAKPTLARSVYPYSPGPRLLQGRLPSGATEVMLEKSTALHANLKLGDAARLVWDGKVHRMMVVGIGSYEAPLGNTTVAFVNSQNAMSWFAPSGRVSQIAIKVGSVADADTVLRNVATALGPEVKVLRGDELRQERAYEVLKSWAYVIAAVSFFMVLMLLAGVFLMMTGLSLALEARRDTLATLRAVGYPPATLRKIICGEFLIEAVTGSLLGLALAAAATLAVRIILGSLGWGFTAGLPIPPLLALGIVVLGLLMSLVAAVVPVRHAGRTAPSAPPAIDHDRIQADLRKRTVIGVILLVVAIGIGIGATFKQATSLAVPVLSLSLVASLIFLVSIAVLLVQLQRPVFSLCAALSASATRLPSRLALQGLRRSPRRAAKGLPVVVIGIAIAVAGGIIADSVRVSEAQSARAEIQSDLLVVASQPNSRPERAQVRILKVPAVRSTSADITQAEVQIRVSKNSFERVKAVGITDAATNTAAKSDFNAENIAALQQGMILVGAKQAAREGLKIGDSISVSGENGIYSTRVGGIVKSSLFDADIYVDPSLLRQIAASEGISTSYISVYLRAGSDGNPLSDTQIHRAQQDIQKALNPLHLYQVYSPEEFAASKTSNITWLQRLTYGFMGLVMLLALVSIMNLSELSVRQRRQSLTLLRELGMKPRSIAASVRLEAFFTVLSGSIIGYLAGLGMGAWWCYLLHGQGIDTFSLPWVWHLAIIGGTLILTPIVATPAARAAARTPLPEATLVS